MAGLALGSWLGRRFGDRVAQPVKLFLALELGIATSGLALVHGLPALTSLFVPALAPLADAPLVLGTARFGIALGLLLIPTTAMGMTLPLLVRALAQPEHGFGSVALPSLRLEPLGAVAGVPGTEVVTIEAFGLRGAGLVAASANLAAAGLVVSQRGRALPVADETEIAHTVPPTAGWTAIAAAFIAGFVLLAFGVVGFRFLSLFATARTTRGALASCGGPRGGPPVRGGSAAARARSGRTGRIRARDRPGRLHPLHPRRHRRRGRARPRRPAHRAPVPKT